MKMKRCVLCGKLEKNLIGRLCGRCDHIQGDVVADLQAESKAGWCR